MAACIICGELAKHAVPDGDYKFLPVCDKHLYPAYRIRMYLAMEDLKWSISEEITKLVNKLVNRKE